MIVEVKLMAIKDGDKWALVLEGFQNLQVSDCVWINEPVFNDVLDESFRMLIEKALKRAED